MRVFHGFDFGSSKLSALSNQFRFAIRQCVCCPMKNNIFLLSECHSSLAPLN